MFPAHQGLNILTPSIFIFFEKAVLLGSEGILMVWIKDWGESDVIGNKGENAPEEHTALVNITASSSL